MVKFKLIYLITIILIWSSCKTEQKHRYAIRDFSKTLQPYLNKFVSKGIGGYFDSALRRRVSEQEIIQLSQSEHQMLRSGALIEMLEHPGFNPFEVVMNHLDDTATLAVDGGEFGTYFTTVSDYLLEHAEWKSLADKEMTIHEVITKHNYLKSAYTILERIEPQERYYPYIKNMAQRKLEIDDQPGERKFHQIEYALYGLAKFRKKEDINLIQDLLLENCMQMSTLSLRLMREFPDSSYMPVLEKYYRIFYRSIHRREETRTAVDFIKTIATYKNNRSAEILDSILNKKPFLEAPGNREYFAYVKNEIQVAIWDNDCDAYSKLRKQIESEIRDYKKDVYESPIPDTSIIVKDSTGLFPDSEMPTDTRPTVYRWWQ